MRPPRVAWLLPLFALACGGADPEAPPALTSQAGAAGAPQAGAAGAPLAGAAGAPRAGAAGTAQAGAAGAAEAGAAGMAQAGAAGASTWLSVAPTDQTLPIAFTISIAGEGTSRIGDVALDANVGAVTVGGVSYQALAYEHQAWPEFGYELFQALAVGPDRLFSLWFYCKGDALDWVYFEGTDGTTMTDEPAQKGGSCAFSATPSSPHVKLPASSFAAPAPITGFEVKGAQLELPSGQKGTLSLGPVSHEVYVFDSVDCSTDCGSPGWWELHALLWDPKAARLCFTIFYLPVGQSQVWARYSIALPDLTDPIGDLTLTATWTKL